MDWLTHFCKSVQPASQREFRSERVSGGQGLDSFTRIVSFKLIEQSADGRRIWLSDHKVGLARRFSEIRSYSFRFFLIAVRAYLSTLFSDCVPSFGGS